MDLTGAPTPATTDDVRMRAARAARTSYGRLLALLAARSGDIESAEDALADAFERALATWPDRGVPDNPEAWLLTVARNRLRDRWRSAAVRTSVPLDPARDTALTVDDIDPDAVGDRRLELMLVCAHPAIAAPARTPLMLNTVLGYTAAQIAAVLVVPAPTVAARLVRAKRRIRQTGIPFRIPDRSVLAERMPHVLEAVYGAFAIDWSIGGTEARRPHGDEALHLAETLAELSGDAEAHGLAALVCFSTARAPARVDDSGAMVPLTDQDTSWWDRDLIERGRHHLRLAHTRTELGRYQLEAAIQAVHCARVDGAATDWATLADLHTTLHSLAPTLGSASALAAVTAEVDGPEAGLAILDRLGASAERFQPAWATRAHLSARLGRLDAASAAYDRAISLTTDPVERAHLVGARMALSPPDRTVRGS